MSTVSPSPRPRRLRRHRATPDRRRGPVLPRLVDLLQGVLHDQAQFQRLVILVLLVLAVTSVLGVVFVARAPEIVSIVTAVRGRA